MTLTSVVPSNETPILNKLISIREKLTTLKKDRSTFLKSSDINELYEQLIVQVRKINHIREDPNLKDEQNRLDTVLEDVFQLVSLSFLTVGLTRVAPATFASLSTVHRILDHLEESKIYSANDLKSVRERLAEIKDIVKRDASSESPEVIQLIISKIAVCETTLKELEGNLSSISHDLQPILQQLVAIRRQIMAIGSKPKFSSSDFKPLQEELREIEAKRVDGNFLSPDGNIPIGQSQLNALIVENHEILNDFIAAKGETVSEGLQPLYKELSTMKSHLENLSLTHRWTMRETDLYTYQKRLQEIDDKRVNGVFLDKDGHSGSGQSVLLYLLRRCYALIYKLLSASEPVSEALMPIQNQLSTVRRCLLEVKRMGGFSSARELYPYQMKLASIDNMRVDGKFMVGDNIPEGQGVLNALLSECFDICHELRVELEEQDSDK